MFVAEGQGLLFSCRKVSQVTSHPSTFEDCFRQKNLMGLTTQLAVVTGFHCTNDVYISYIYIINHNNNDNIITIIITLIIFTTLILPTKKMNISFPLNLQNWCPPSLGLLSIQLGLETASEKNPSGKAHPKWKVTGDSPEPNIHENFIFSLVILELQTNDIDYYCN